jgi:UDP-2,4-diacetamido-2,4,6-trideoxy-beta-L-altropyranose hydrolase
VSAEPLGQHRLRLVDGVERPSVSLRPAVLADRERIWHWRNERGTRAASFDSATIRWDTHVRWFDNALQRSDRKIFIIEADSVAVGTVRLDIVEREASVSIHLAQEWRGQGFGSSALRALAELAFGPLEIDRLIASIKPDNQVSIGAFAKAGFITVEVDAVVRFERRRLR